MRWGSIEQEDDHIPNYIADKFGTGRDAVVSHWQGPCPTNTTYLPEVPT